MNIALFAPLNPQTTGVADSVEELLPALAERCVIDLFVDGIEPATEFVRAGFRVFDYRHHPDTLSTLGRYDAAVYHVGNDPRWHAGIVEVAARHRGVLVLHEVSFEHYFRALAQISGNPAIYWNELNACHGVAPRRRRWPGGWRAPEPHDPLLFPMVQRIASRARGLMVHSHWARRFLAEQDPTLPPAMVIPQIGTAAGMPREVSGADGLSGTVTIGSFGQVIGTKGVDRILRALASLKGQLQFEYVIAGTPNAHYDAAAIVRQWGLEDRVRLTGHLDGPAFERALASVDVAVNLREQTLGEASGCVCRLLGQGIPTIVTDQGWFGELPATAVAKIPSGDDGDAVLVALLRRLIGDPALRRAMGRNAWSYAREHHSPAVVAAATVAHVQEIVDADVRRLILATAARDATAAGVHGDDLLRGIAGNIDALLPSAPAGRPQVGGGRVAPVPDLDYVKGAVDYLSLVSENEREYLVTKPFYNVALPRPSARGDGMDPETHRYFCDFANIATALRLPAASRILDVGCGSGWLSEYFARLGYHVTGIDISPGLVAMSQARVASIACGVDPRTPLTVDFRVCDVSRAALSEQFDAIVCYDSLHHFEDEQQVVINLVSMLRPGGLLMIIEGDRPAAGSEGERELVAVMEQYATLESPFDRSYLRRLLESAGLTVIGDFVPVNGMFDRSMASLPLSAVAPSVNYLLAKRCSQPAAGTSADVAPMESMRATWGLQAAPDRVRSNQAVEFVIDVTNASGRVWLADWPMRRGVVTVGRTLRAASGHTLNRTHGEPRLPRSLGPGERATITVPLVAPQSAGAYQLVLDLVAHDVCWFSERGSDTLTIPFTVA